VALIDCNTMYFFILKCVYTLPVKSFRSVRFFMFLNEVSFAHQSCFIWWKKM